MNEIKLKKNVTKETVEKINEKLAQEVLREKKKEEEFFKFLESLGL